MNRRDLFVIFLIVLTDLIGFGIVIPILPTISEQLNITGLTLGLLVSAYPLAQFFAAPILGSLSDRYGRKPILVISKLGTVVAYLIFAYARSLPLLLISKLIDGATGGNISAARAYISDITTKENRSRGMAVIGMGFGLGFIIGPALGGTFYSISGSQTLPSLVGAGLCLISAVLTQLLLKEHSKPITSYPNFSTKKFFAVFRHPDIRQIFLVQFLFMVAMSSFQTTFNFFTDISFGLTASQNSYILVYLGVLSFLVQSSFLRRPQPNPHFQSQLGLFLSTVGIVLVALSPSLWIMLPVLIIYIIGNAFAGVFLPTLLSTTSSTDPEGQIQGAFESVGSLARIIGPAIAGSLIVNHSRYVYLFLAFLVLLALFFLSRPVSVRLKE